MHNYKNILVVRTDRIGDVVLTLKSISALRNTFKDARITVLVNPVTKDLVKGYPDINEVLLDDRNNINKGFIGFWKLVNLIKSKNFDLAVNYHTKKRTNLLCFFARIPVRIGYYNNKYGFLLSHRISDDRPTGKKHETEYCLDVIKNIGVEPLESDIVLPLQRESEEWADKFFSKNVFPEIKESKDSIQLHDLKVCKGIDSNSCKIIAIHTGASCPTKKWPVKRFVDLMNKLHEKYKVMFLVIGASDNNQTVEQIIPSVKGKTINLVGKTSVGQLVSVLKRCDILISNDSGPVHIASGVNTPVVSIFTRNQPGINPERWKPLGGRSRYVSTPPYNDKLFAKSRISDPKCLELIPVKDVMEAVDAIFKL